MKKMILATALSVLALNAYAAPIGSGEVRAIGEFKGSTCAIKAGDTLKELDFGETELNGKKGVSAAQKVDIHLENCRLVNRVVSATDPVGQLYNAVTVYFQPKKRNLVNDFRVGNEVANDTTGGAELAATNVTLELQDRNAMTVDFSNIELQKNRHALQIGQNVSGDAVQPKFEFHAFLHHEADTKPGLFSATIPFHVEYK